MQPALPYVETVPAFQQLTSFMLKRLPVAGQLLPPALLELAVAQALNRALASALRAGALAELEGRWLAIDCTDWPYPLRISRQHQRLIVQVGRGPIDACIRGDLDAFLTLLRQDIDPDTLFFQRKLAMHGDTELALAVKNFLDSLDAEQMPTLLRALLRAGHP